MNGRTRIAALVAIGVFACAACAPSSSGGSGSAGATSEPRLLADAVGSPPREQTSIPGTETAYPPPMQTEKSVEATEMAERQWARETAAATGRDQPITSDDMVHYANTVLGLSFAYPRALGDVEFVLNAGETGEKWGLYFSRYDALVLAGVSPDFSEGRGGLDVDTYGFARPDDGNVRWLLIPSAPDGEEIEVEEILSSESGVEAVAFLLPPAMGSLDDATPGPPAALVNLAGNRFPGLIVLSHDPVRLPAATLKAILQTIEVTEPTEAGDGAKGRP